MVVDAQDPHTLADWWAAALGWQVEPSDEELIRRLVAAGQAAETDTLVHNGVLVWRVGAAIRDPDHPDRPRVLFQAVPEPKSGKNRVHLDIRTDDREAAAQRLTEAGATELHRASQGPFSWITMADPEGNEFCVT